MENNSLNKPLETPSKANDRWVIPVFAGASLLLFALFIVFSLISSFPAGSSFDSSYLLGILASLYPLSFSLALLLRKNRFKKGWLFGLTTGGIILWCIVLYIFLIVFFLVLGPSATLQCQSSSSTSPSSACQDANNQLNQLFIFSIIFLITGLLYEAALGISLFGKKRLPLLLYISLGLLIVSNTLLAVFLLRGLGSNLWFYVFPFIGSDFLGFLICYISLKLPEEKASPYSEDALEQ
jgi:hypothetical protein